MNIQRSRILPPILCFLSLFSTNLLACEDIQFSEFDFWIGQWQVKLANGDVAGTNYIQKSLTGCVLEEHYKGSKGYEGKSLNIYDKTTQQWHQTWTDNTGLLLKLDGQFKDNKMVLWGNSLDFTGKAVMHRIIWEKPTPQKPLTQVWQVSHNQGLHWEVLFEGFYHKVGASK